MAWMCVDMNLEAPFGFADDHKCCMHVHVCRCIWQYECVTLIFDSDPTGVMCGNLFMSFNSILQDVRDAVDFVHLQVSVKH